MSLLLFSEYYSRQFLSLLLWLSLKPWEKQSSVWRNGFAYKSRFSSLKKFCTFRAWYIYLQGLPKTQWKKSLKLETVLSAWEISYAPHTSQQIKTWYALIYQRLQPINTYFLTVMYFITLCQTDNIIFNLQSTFSCTYNWSNASHNFPCMSQNKQTWQNKPRICGGGSLEKQTGGLSDDSGGDKLTRPELSKKLKY